MRRLIHFCVLLPLLTAVGTANERTEAGKRAVESHLLGRFRLSTVDYFRGPITRGTVVELRVPGLEVSPAAPVAPSFAWQAGRFKRLAAAAMVRDMIPAPVGARFYITRLEAKDNHVVLDVFSVEPVNGIWLRAAVHFDYPKAFLESPDMSWLDQTMAEVFAGPPPPRPPMSAPPARVPSQQQPPPPPPPPRQQTPAQGRPATQRIEDPPPPPAPPPAATGAQQSAPQGGGGAGSGNGSQPAVKTGMSADQVRAAVGPPSQIVTLGNKAIWSYPGYKVTLIGGKVTAVE